MDTGGGGGVIGRWLHLLLARFCPYPKRHLPTFSKEPDPLSHSVPFIVNQHLKFVVFTSICRCLQHYTRICKRKVVITDLSIILHYLAAEFIMNKNDQLPLNNIFDET